MSYQKVIEIHCDSCFTSTFGGFTMEEAQQLLKVYGWVEIEGQTFCPACLAEYRNEPPSVKALERKAAKARQASLQDLKKAFETQERLATL